MKRIFLSITAIVIVAAILLIIITWWRAISPNVEGWNFAILNLLELVGLVIAFALASFVLYQFIRRFLLNQWIFEGFSNASNLSDLLATRLKMTSFHVLAMEELLNQSKIISKQWNQDSLDTVILDDKYWKTPILKTQLPKDFINGEDVIAPLRPDIFDWVKSAEDKVPQGFAFIMSLINFVGATLPAPIIKITGHLQLRSDSKAGITLAVVDTKKPSNNAIYTFWQDDRADSSLAQSSTGSEGKLIDSYIELLSPAMRWLALIWWNQQLESRKPLRNFVSGNRVQEKAVLLYRLGVLFYTSNVEFTRHKSIFLQLAIKYLNQALDANQDWYYPSLYLANVYSFEMQGAEDETYKKMFGEALKLFNKALACAKRADEGIDTEQRIILARMLTELTSDIRTFDERHIREVLAPEIAEIKAYIDSDSFDFERKDSAAFLYNLATWYRMAYNSRAAIPGVDTRKEARLYLAYCLALSDDLRDKVEYDTNFKFLYIEGDLEFFIEELAKHQKLMAKAERAKMGKKDFKTEIDEILERVDERLGRR